MKEEIWLPVKGYEAYSISNFGNVKRGSRILKQHYSSTGYFQLSLSRNGIKITRKIHIMVAQAFLGDRPYKMEVCHSDGNSRNNKLENLRYDTRSANCMDAYRHGTLKIKKGEMSNLSKLKSEDVLNILEMRKKYKVYEIASLFGVTDDCIYSIYNGTNWRHLTKIERKVKAS